jgi:FKBP-type peptidyl-prolyl cis-trans isomerase FkpA
MMKNIFWSLLFSVVLFGCFKDTNQNHQCNYPDSPTIAPDSQVQKVKAYLDSNGIIAQKNPSGFYYSIHSQGTGGFVTNLCSVVTVNYKGKLTNGSIFDSTTTNNPAAFALGRFIVGWQKGIPLINNGGSITLYIPPSLGYQAQDIRDNQGHIVIPGNSILIFDIEVLNISG